MAEKKNIDKQKLEEQKAYNEYVKEVTPTHSLPKNMAKAFLTGGIICVRISDLIKILQEAGAV